MAETAQITKVLSFEDARHTVEEHAQSLTPGGSERVDLLATAGRVLSEPLIADRDFPPFPRSARDGYAIRSEDLAKLPTSLEVIGEIKAGVNPEEAFELKSGQAAAIMTGAPAPKGADAVVMVEYTSMLGQHVEIMRAVSAGENIVPRGSEARAGDVLLDKGTRVDHSVIGIAASSGKNNLSVYVRPRVAVLSTGDEIVDISTQPGANQIRNSNAYSLAAQISAAGGDPVLLPIAPDEPQRLCELIIQGFHADLLLLTGGVSMGKYDLVEQVLDELKAEFFFTGAQIQPGRPVVFGRARMTAQIASCDGAASGQNLEASRYFLGLPGNPISTMVTFDLFARPLLDSLAGLKAAKLMFLQARLRSEIKTKTGLKRFLPGVLSGEFEQAEVELAKWQGSGDLAAVARANCYVVIPPDRERIAAGESVPVMMK